MADTGWLDRPSYYTDYLLDTVGYVTQIWITQEGPKDELHFRMKIIWSGGTAHKEFCIPLYVNTTVALAQLQLLRDALRWTWGSDQYGRALLVRVHFNFRDLFTGDDESYVYWVNVMSGFPDGTSVEDFYRTSPTTWYVYDFLTSS